MAGIAPGGALLPGLLYLSLLFLGLSIYLEGPLGHGGAWFAFGATRRPPYPASSSLPARDLIAFVFTMMQLFQVSTVDRPPPPTAIPLSLTRRTSDPGLAFAPATFL